MRINEETTLRLISRNAEIIILKELTSIARAFDELEVSDKKKFTGLKHALDGFLERSQGELKND